jgi:hypothetical protein
MNELEAVSIYRRKPQNPKYVMYLLNWARVHEKYNGPN